MPGTCPSCQDSLLLCACSFVAKAGDVLSLGNPHQHRRSQPPGVVLSTLTTSLHHPSWWPPSTIWPNGSCLFCCLCLCSDDSQAWPAGRGGPGYVKVTGKTACQPAATACAKGQYASSTGACANCGAGQSSPDGITYVALLLAWACSWLSATWLLRDQSL